MNTLQPYITRLLTQICTNSLEFTHHSPVPHCSNPRCPRFADQPPHDQSWFKFHGCYFTKAFGRVPRYRCQDCGKTFSLQTFRMDYYVKKPVDYIQLIRQLVSSSGQGNMTRFTGMRYEQIQNRYERICRVLLAIHSDMRKLIKPEDEFALDGFESFSVSQFFPNNINILVGSSSELIYAMGYSQLRRKGRMTERQKQKRTDLEQTLGKAPGNAVEKSVQSILTHLCKYMKDKDIPAATLNTDYHKAYVRALSKLPEGRSRIRHCQYSSTLPRTPTNRLFPVNYVDRQFRKDQANHVRESVQFARCPAAMMVRLSIYQMVHNYLMPRRVRDQRKGNWKTRGEQLGVPAWKLHEVLRKHWNRRVFLNKCTLWEHEKMTWLLGWRNRGIPSGRRLPFHVWV